MNKPWSFEELRKVMPKRIAEMNRQWPDAKPLPAMTVDECIDFIQSLLDIAAERALRADELFLFGQLLSIRWR